VLTARAIAEDGEEQPTTHAWNRGGFANNAIQRVDAYCTP
jgi:hypothetical protein